MAGWPSSPAASLACIKVRADGEGGPTVGGLVSRLTPTVAVKERIAEVAVGLGFGEGLNCEVNRNPTTPAARVITAATIDTNPESN